MEETQQGPGEISFIGGGAGEGPLRRVGKLPASQGRTGNVVAVCRIGIGQSRLYSQTLRQQGRSFQFNSARFHLLQIVDDKVDAVEGVELEVLEIHVKQSRIEGRALV